MKQHTVSLALACLLTSATLSATAQGLRPAAGSGLTPRLPAAISSLPAAGSNPQGLRQADFIVAVVNSEPLTNNEVRQRAERVAQQLRTQGEALPSAQALTRETLERLIVEKIQIQLARETGIQVDDYAVDQAELSVARQNDLSLLQMEQRLAQEGLTRQRFRDNLREQLLLLRVREREVESKVRVSDLDIDQYLRDQQNTAGAGKQMLNLGHILLTLPENPSAQELEQARNRAQELLAKLQAGEDFATLARNHSQAPEGRDGGSLGLRPAERYPELFVNAVQNTPEGGVAGPLRSPAGLHLLKVEEKRQAGTAPSSAWQTHARHILLRSSASLSEAQAASRLQELRERVQRGQADFATLAKENSQDGSAKDGGDLGWALPGRYVPEFEEVLDALKPGEISAPVVSRFGVHLIQLIERRQVKLSQREQRDMVRSAVREKKLDEAFANWVQETRARAYVEYREPPQ